MAYAYDSRDNLIALTDARNQTTTFTYDRNNRLTEVKDGSENTIAAYVYDPFGRRIKKFTSSPAGEGGEGVTTYYLYSDEGLIGEYDNTGAEKKTYGYKPDSTWTTDPVFTKEGGSYYFYHNDHLGTPMKITNANGNVVWSATYDAFGKATVDASSTITNNLRFPGQYFDSETGLHYNYERYYDPNSGRYVAEDRIRIKGEDNNLYIYSRNNSLRYIDPMGLSCGSGWTDFIVPDSPYGICFTPACAFHDKCYATCGVSKVQCDRAFWLYMMSICFQQNTNAQKYMCFYYATLYYSAVVSLGGPAYRESQKRCQCIKKK